MFLSPPVTPSEILCHPLSDLPVSLSPCQRPASETPCHPLRDSPVLSDAMASLPALITPVIPQCPLIPSMSPPSYFVPPTPLQLPLGALQSPLPFGIPKNLRCPPSLS